MRALWILTALLASGCGIANDSRNARLRDAELDGRLKAGMSVADVEAIAGAPITGGTRFVRDGSEVVIWNSGSGFAPPYDMEFHDGHLFSWTNHRD